MSLYVGRLSPHVRREELERVFRRFGQCNFQLKDGYGFVIYEVIADAERALRSLRGKSICGGQISLNWSNRQPRPFQRSSRSTRVYRGKNFREEDEPYCGKNFREEDKGVGIHGSCDYRNFYAGGSHLMSTNREGYPLDDACEKAACQTSDDIDDHGEEKGRNLKERMQDGSRTIEPNPEEIDRWGETASDTLIGHGMENAAEFDHYEPYHGCKGRDESFTDHANSPEKGWRGESTDEIDRHLSKLKPQLTCYRCGLVGHIAPNCPEGDFRWEKFGKFNHKRDEINSKGRGDGRLKRPRPNCWGRRNSTRDSLISRCPQWGQQKPHSRKVRRVIKSESSPERKEKHCSKLGRESEKRVKKREALKKRKAKRSRTSRLSCDSSATSSHSQSKFNRSSSGTSSHSVLRSAHPASPSLKSACTSSYSKSLCSRSSSPGSRSLSVSLDLKQPASPENVHMDAPVSTSPKGNLEHACSPEPSNNFLIISESSEPKGTCASLKDENAFISSKVNVENTNEHPAHDGDARRDSACKVTYKETNSFNDPLEDVALISGKFLENCGETSELQVGVSWKPNMLGGCTKITAEELFLALRHYGLPVPDVVESGISVQEYFGAARLWPWEMIFYRRLKKGPITAENYAKRLEQNKEFGIVDKYIRSSSGWGDLNQNYS